MFKYQNQTEQELVAAYAQGETSAIDELVYRTQNKVLSTVYYLVRDKDLAQDLVQETYIKAVAKIKEGKYVNDGKLTAWLNRIARNLCMDYFRRTDKHKTVSTANGGKNIFDFLPLQEDSFEQKVISNQSATRVRGLLEQLPHDQREVITMRIFGEMTFKEIAEETNASLNTCLGRMRYGLLNLRKMIRERELVL
jgi:RNA polymerase sigma factor (sigma-70 family)